MKRYFVETAGYNMVAFVDDNGECYILHEGSFDEPLTLEVAKNADYSNLDGCETADECAECMGIVNDENRWQYRCTFDELIITNVINQLKTQTNEGTYYIEF